MYVFVSVVCPISWQIAYWEVYDGSAIRVLDGSLSGAINGMHITLDGKHFVTGMWNLFFSHSLSMFILDTCSKCEHLRQPWLPKVKVYNNDDVITLVQQLPLMYSFVALKELNLSTLF